MAGRRLIAVCALGSLVTLVAGCANEADASKISANATAAVTTAAAANTSTAVGTAAATSAASSATVVATSTAMAAASTTPAASAAGVAPGAPGARPDTNGNAPGIPALSGEIKQTASGLRYIDERVGTGAAAQAGRTVGVHYTGWLTNGQKFDSSRDRGQPFAFRLGAGMVIKGWDEGVAGMQVGGKRRLIIPPALGYGSQALPGLPANSTLIFDVELLAIQ